MTIHLVTSAPVPTRRHRLAVCFGAICEPGYDAATAYHQTHENGLPFASGTKRLDDVTCDACLDVAQPLVDAGVVCGKCGRELPEYATGYRFSCGDCFGGRDE